MSTQAPTDVPRIDDWNRLLEGRVAVVTGGGVGIGGAISRLFAAHGAFVEIAEIDPDRAEQAKADIEGAGGVARAHIVDVRKFHSARNGVRAVRSAQRFVLGKFTTFLKEIIWWPLIHARAVATAWMNALLVR